MATTRRKNTLVAEDWKKIYQTFREADFQSYDFETLRKSMVDYLRLYYPEDFNDFIESSEFISLIDLIAFLGQGLAFRADLNARENFIDTAERRDSILKLARLINYNPKRNSAASGLLKIGSVRTTESLFDSDGISLTGTTINWNDRTNGNWQEQFITVLNAALVDSQRFGRPGNTASINEVKTDEYQLNLTNLTSSPVFQFTSNVDGLNLNFEVVGATSINNIVLYEPAPRPGGNLNILFRNDRLGNNSANTGFFMHFKQGVLNNRRLSFVESLPNRVENIAVSNINNTDVWLYELDAQGNPTTLWTPVPAIIGNNVAYNTISRSNRKVYQINTRDNDQIDLVFGDGVFSDIPQGNFILYYRTSVNDTYRITPDEMQAISIDIPYISRTGRTETLRLTGSLQYTVTNASARESLEEIREKAPQQYYTQNRIVTAEDYNLFPYTAFGNIVKVKAVNRTSSGISRFLDVVDTTGKYSSTNIFSDDGWFYREDAAKTFSFSFVNRNDVLRVLRGEILSIINSKEMTNFYYENFDRIAVTSLTTWGPGANNRNQSTGFFKDSSENPVQLGDFASNFLRYFRPGAIIKITAPSGKYFDQNNYLRIEDESIPLPSGSKYYFYTSVVSVIGDGTNSGQGLFDTGIGPVTLNDYVPEGAKVEEVFPSFSRFLGSELEQEVLEKIYTYQTFGLRYDPDSREYAIVDSENLNTDDELFSLADAGDDSGTAADASWLIRFQAVSDQIVVTYRNLNFVFESKRQTRFYFDPSVRVYDSRTSSIVNDNIRILRINSLPDSNTTGLGFDYFLQIHDVFLESDGYEDNTKIKVTYPDSDQDGIPDNIDAFKNVVNPTENPDSKYVYFARVNDIYGYSRFEPVEKLTINDSYATKTAIETDLNLYNSGQIFFATTEKKFYELDIDNGSRSLVDKSDEYRYKTGRGELYFQYKHNSPDNRRIDPSPNNIIDLYILTKNYDDSFRSWVQDSSGKVAKPVAPTSEELSTEFAMLEQYKPMSDALLYNNAKFKVIFGEKADASLRGTIKIVKSFGSLVSDSEIKSRAVEAINEYFSLGNWDFGDTFYFSDMSTYLHSVLSASVSSIVLVPENGAFGDLYQVNCNPDEIFISAATVDNIEIISAVTPTQIKRS